VILTAVNFITVLLFVPETRYKREEVAGVGMAICPSNAKIIATDEKFLRRSSDDEEFRQTPKKSWMQELSLWSGVSDTNLAKMFVRCVLPDSRFHVVVTDAGQTIPDARLPIGHICIPGLFYLPRHHRGSQYLEPVCTSSPSIQLESTNQRLDQHPRYPRKLVRSLGRR
jgi:hypothetical protein